MVIIPTWWHEIIIIIHYYLSQSCWPSKPYDFYLGSLKQLQSDGGKPRVMLRASSLIHLTPGLGRFEQLEFLAHLSLSLLFCQYGGSGFQRSMSQEVREPGAFYGSGPSHTEIPLLPFPQKGAISREME